MHLSLPIALISTLIATATANCAVGSGLTCPDVGITIAGADLSSAITKSGVAVSNLNECTDYMHISDCSGTTACSSVSIDGITVYYQTGQSKFICHTDVENGGLVTCNCSA